MLRAGLTEINLRFICILAYLNVILKLFTPIISLPILARSLTKKEIIHSSVKSQCHSKMLVELDAELKIIVIANIY